MPRPRLKSVALLCIVGLLTTAAVVAVSITLGDILQGPLQPSEYPEQGGFTAVFAFAPFVVLAVIGLSSLRVAAIAALMTALVWAVMWSWILQPDPSIVGADIGAGIALLFSPIAVTALAVVLEFALRTRGKRGDQSSID